MRLYSPRLSRLDSVITTRGDVILLRVRATAGSSRDRIEGIHDDPVRGGALRVAVRAAPERGKANRAIEALLARALGLRRSQVALESGVASRDKAFRISGVSRADLEERLARRFNSE